MTSTTLVKIKQQVDYSEFPFKLCDMNLHRQTDERKSNSLAIFVHGLNGGGYKTWGEFPERLFSNATDTRPDVAVFDYFSGRRRYLRARPTVSDVAEVLTRCIIDVQDDYQEIFLVAHSLGGLISRDAVRIYLQKFDQVPYPLKKVAGIIHFATPLRGSKWALRFLWPAIVEIKYLWPRSKYQLTIAKFFEETVDTTNQARIGNRDYTIPVFAGYGTKDWVVTRSSATANVFHKQDHPFRAGHSKIVKPFTDSDEQVTWVQNCMRSVSANRVFIRELLYQEEREKRRNSTSKREKLITEMVSTPPQHEWRRLYHEAVSTASTNNVDVFDHAEIDTGATMLLSLHSANDIIGQSSECEAVIGQAVERYAAGQTDVRVISIGVPADQAETALRRTITADVTRSSPPWLFFDAVENSDGLRKQLHEYFRLMTDFLERRIQSTKYRATGKLSIVESVESLLFEDDSR